MILINGANIDYGNFPDGTPLIKCDPKEYVNKNYAKLTWKYENDGEFLTLVYLVKHLRSHGVNDIYLYMPYIPNARMDRVKNSEDVFTLKYFAELLNSLNLTRVEVLDPHSNVSEALINNLYIHSPGPYIQQVVEKIMPKLRKIHEPDAELMIFYPDEGSMKRYSGMLTIPYTFGVKHRDWETGKIIALEAAGLVGDIPGKNVLIIDDICSRGGTFLHSAKKLKELGAKDIYLFVSHCENTILEGELLQGDLIKKVYTTDSIFTASHEKVEVLK